MTSELAAAMLFMALFGFCIVMVGFFLLTLIGVFSR